MVDSKKILLELKIELDIPNDILTESNRYELIQQGIIQSISKGLYQEGVSFKVQDFSFTIS